MAWTAPVMLVVVVLPLLTSGDGGVLASAQESAKDTSSLSKTMFLKPMSNVTTKITIITGGSYGHVGVNVTLEEKCFNGTLKEKCCNGWVSSQVNVTKFSTNVNFSLRVGDCEVNCTQRKVNDGKISLEKISVFPHDLLMCGEDPPNKKDNIANYDIHPCNNEPVLREETHETPSYTCAPPTSVLPSTAETTTSPLQDSPTSGSPPPSNDHLKAPPNKRFSKLATVLLVAEVVQVLGVCAMTFVAVVVISRISRMDVTIIRLDSDQEIHEDGNFSGCHSRNFTSEDNHE